MPVPLGQVLAQDGVRPQEVDALEVVAGLQAEVLEVRGPDGDLPQAVRAVQVDDPQAVPGKLQPVEHP